MLSVKSKSTSTTEDIYASQDRTNKHSRNQYKKTSAYQKT